MHPSLRLSARSVVAAAILIVTGGTHLAAQEPVSLDQAVSMALSRGPSVAMAVADSALAQAFVSQARAIPNPTATAQYTKSTPQHHLEVEQPIPFPWTRSARVSASVGATRAASLRLELERATVTHDVEVAYATAAATERRRDLSAQTAADALELVDIANRRLEAGDASELEVALARLAAGEAVNQASSDSLAATSSVLELQFLIGEPLDRTTIQLTDTLALPDPTPSTSTSVPLAVPLSVSAARADADASEAALTYARRSRVPAPSIVAGFERHDPSGGEPGTLPVIGLVMSIPLFNQGGGEVGQARAEADRARGALQMAQRESDASVAVADRARAAARARAIRDRSLLEDAERVATLSNRAYEEGAFPLTSVLEAQRSARDARIRYVEDVATARIFESDYVLATRAGRQP
jgi:cobalt-zinc-cadmium efflux system outer membrane protein